MTLFSQSFVILVKNILNCFYFQDGKRMIEYLVEQLIFKNSTDWLPKVTICTVPLLIISITAKLSSLFLACIRHLGHSLVTMFGYYTFKVNISTNSNVTDLYRSEKNTGFSMQCYENFAQHNPDDQSLTFLKSSLHTSTYRLSFTFTRHWIERTEHIWQVF